MTFRRLEQQFFTRTKELFANTDPGGETKPRTRTRHVSKTGRIVCGRCREYIFKKISQSLYRYELISN